MESIANITQTNTYAAASYKKIVVGFMQEDNGNFSSMRLISFIALISAIAFGVITSS